MSIDGTQLHSHASGTTQSAGEPPAAAPANDSGRPGIAAPARRRVPLSRVPLSTWAALLLIVLAVGPITTRWQLIHAAVYQLGAADRDWLLVAAAATASTWVSSAIAQQGAVVRRLPPGRLIAAQLAASAANHILPTGIGGSAVNARFLYRCGVSAGRCATALAVKAFAACAVRLVLVAMLAVALPGVLAFPHRLPTLPAQLTWVLAGAVIAGALICARAARVRARAWSLLATTFMEARAIHASRARATALWGGSLGFVCLNAAVLVAVVRALDVPVPASHVALAYLTASSAAALVPTPGGLGSLDAALALALAATGATGIAATSAVLGYRLLTVWLPLAPGLLVLGLLVRRKLL